MNKNLCDVSYLDRLTFLPKDVINELPLVIIAFGFTTTNQLSHFLGQCYHESCEFKVKVENLNYSESALLKTFKKYFTPTTAKTYARNPEMIASKVYANRMGNGDEASKDGWKYRGRGYIQLTGKENYTLFNEFLLSLELCDYVNVVENPDTVASKYPLLSAGWYWHKRKINNTANKDVKNTTIGAVTRLVNGGNIGLESRIISTRQFYEKLTH